MLTPSTYRTPGVYVERLDANAQQLEVGRTDIAGLIGIAERGPLHSARKIESVRQFVTTFGLPIAQAYLAYAVEGFFTNGGRACWVVRVADPSKATRARIRVMVAGGQPFVLEAESPGAWGNGIRIEPVWDRDGIVALNASAQNRPEQAIELGSTGQPLERLSQITLLGVRDSSLPELTRESLVQRGANDEALPLIMLGPGVRGESLAGGADGVASLKSEHFRWGIDALARVDGISFVAAPDLMFQPDPSAPDVEFQGFDSATIRDAQIEILSSCIERRDRIALLDLPRVDQSAALRYVRPGSPTDVPLTRTSFAAVYHPWILVNDSLRLLGNVRAIPPSGHVAGMFARTDRLLGVHKPPANEVLEGVWDLTELLDDAAHARLNEASINAVRVVPGRGVLVLGARTLDRDARWRYVNVRRLFAMIEEALDEQLQWLTFEPNNPRLWREIDRTVRGFLQRLYGVGMLDGATSEEAYFVRCDESTNPPSGTDDGRVTCEMGIQPPYPAEFVIVRIGVTRSGVQIEEDGAQDA